MRYTTLGNTDIQVSIICLGTMTYGEQNTEAEAHEQLSYAIDQGINFIDTAEMYPVPPMEKTSGRTESFIGSWLKHQDRSKIILASKIAGPGFAYMRGGSHLSKDQVTKALNSSLERLNTDYIDLYQVHWPERDTNYFGKLGYQHSERQTIAIEETLEALDQQVQAGKIRTVGISNETPWGMLQYLRLAEKNGWTRIQSIQNPYSLLNRSFEVGCAEIAQREKVGLLAYSPLGFGVLSGKYVKGQSQARDRLNLYSRFDRYTNPQGIKATKAYVELAEQHSLTPSQMALAYVNSRSFLTSNIIGATTMEQLRENIESVNVNLSDNVLESIEQIHTEHSNPCP